MKLFTFVTTTLLYIISVTGNFVMANSPSIKPDWSNTKNQQLNLSGNIVRFTLPSGLSSDTPATLNNNANLYDEKNYGNWKLFPIGKFWWDYKKKSFFLLSELYGTLELKISVLNTGSDEDIANPDVFQKQIISIMNEISLDSFAKPLDLSEFNIALENRSTANFMKYYYMSENPAEIRTWYALRLTDQHYLELSFRIIKSKPFEEDSWKEHAEKDINKILDSFPINVIN